MKSVDKMDKPAEEQSENSMLHLYKDDGYIELVLKVLASMCDGQNTVLQVHLLLMLYFTIINECLLPFKVSWIFVISQNYLREQPDNIKSVNLVAETAKYLHLLYDNVNSSNISLTTQIFITLIEYATVNKLDILMINYMYLN